MHKVTIHNIVQNKKHSTPQLPSKFRSRRCSYKVDEQRHVPLLRCMEDETHEVLLENQLSPFKVWVPRLERGSFGTVPLLTEKATILKLPRSARLNF